MSLHVHVPCAFLLLHVLLILGHAHCILFYNRINPNHLINITTLCINNTTILLFFPAVSSNAAFNLGSGANLTCGNKTWNKMMFVVWTIEMKSMKPCVISSDSGRSDDHCKDGKSLRNTSRNLSYLHIPNFSERDVGVYKCNSVYSGGNDHYVIHVDIIGRTFLLTRIDDFKNKVNFLKGHPNHTQKMYITAISVLLA